MIKEGLFICRGGRSGAVVIYKFVCLLLGSSPPPLLSSYTLHPLSKHRF